MKFRIVQRPSGLYEIQYRHFFFLPWRNYGHRTGPRGTVIVQVFREVEAARPVVERLQKEWAERKLKPTVVWESTGQPPLPPEITPAAPKPRTLAEINVHVHAHVEGLATVMRDFHRAIRMDLLRARREAYRIKRRGWLESLPEKARRVLA